jgi:hypothetical protein
MHICTNEPAGRTSATEWYARYKHRRTDGQRDNDDANQSIAPAATTTGAHYQWLCVGQSH